MYVPLNVQFAEVLFKAYFKLKFKGLNVIR